MTKGKGQATGACNGSKDKLPKQLGYLGNIFGAIFFGVMFAISKFAGT